MKEKVVSALKKAVVIVIASVMVLGLVPVGLMTLKPNTVSAEGEFLRFAPAKEASVMSRTEEKKAAGNNLAEGLYPVGGESHVYLQFDLQSLVDDKDLGEVKKATLRLIAVNGGIDASQPMRLWLMPSADWNGDMSYEDRPAALGEIKIADLPVDVKGKETQVLEIDLTAYLQKWMEDRKNQVSLHLDAAASSLAAVIAGSSYEDAACRPCLKVVTGEASDPDPTDLTKTWLEKTAQTGTNHSDKELRAGNGADAYLKFRFNPGNIQGAMYLVNLKLRMLHADEDAEIFIYKISNGQWNEGETLPQGEERLIYSSRVDAGAAVQSMDLSHAVNEAYARGEVTLTLRISGGETGQVAFANQGEDAPRLSLRVSDHENIVAATEATVYALEDNASPDAITGNLSESYTTESGTRAEIRWNAVDAITGEDAKEVLGDNGKITRPQWFENSRQIRATAAISSGDYTRERGYLLTVLPEEMPDYTGQTFGNDINLGSSGREDDFGFAEVHVPAHSRWIGGKNFPYRTLGADGSMAMAMAVDPEKQNYLTVKIWKAEKPTSALLIETMPNRTAEPIVITAPAEIAAEDGFLYLTYPVPLAQTQGKQYVSLRFSVDAETAETEEEIVPWNIYNVYSGQSAYFDPLTFADQGEAIAGKWPGSDSSFTKLLRRMYMAAKQPWEDFTELWKSEDAREQQEEAASAITEPPEEEEPEQERFVWMEAQPPMLAFDAGGDGIAISVWETKGRAEIHRNSSLYDTYAETELKNYSDGLTAIDYDKYRVFRNTSGRERFIPWEAEGLSGIYQDMLGGGYYAFLHDGEMADDSVIPAGEVLELGKNLKLSARSTLVLEKLAEPLYGADWRVSAINGRTVAQVKLNRRLTISQVTVKNAGYDAEQETELRLICCAYESGKLSGISQETFSVIPGYGVYQVNLPAMTVMPGQTLKIFVEPANRQPGELTPKLELP
ncbi:MAG: DNRLRE domain-containing protein [Clostridia bacterium]|nr:DNRLRE domain-containing protein [Clostridia bacterium]